MFMHAWPICFGRRRGQIPATEEDNTADRRVSSERRYRPAAGGDSEARAGQQPPDSAKKPLAE